MPTDSRESLARAPEISSATVPTWLTVYMRTCIPWQMVRFAVINLKMLRMIRRSHRA
jgi:hypothetical protein